MFLNFSYFSTPLDSLNPRPSCDMLQLSQCVCDSDNEDDNDNEDVDLLDEEVDDGDCIYK